MRLRFLLAFILIGICTTASYAQLSTKHYIPPIAVSTETPVQLQYIYISTPRNENVSYTIKYLGTGFTESGTVSNSSPVELEIKNPDTGVQDLDSDSQFVVSNGLGLTSTVLNNRGFVIEAQNVIYVSVRVRAGSGNHAGALVSKGASAPGNDFRVGGFVNQGTGGSFQTFFSLMATEDDTNITLNINGTTSNVILQEEETYIESFDIQTGQQPNDMIGSLISADKPVVVNSGSLNGSFTNGGQGSDYGFDQIVDASKIGEEYIFVKGEGNDDFENVLIIAHQDGTEVFINDESGSQATLNAGEWIVFEGNEYNDDGNLYVRSENPVFAYQGIGRVFSNPNFPGANQGMFFVPPLSCENTGDVNNIAFINEIGDVDFAGGITVVTEVGATVDVNGEPIANFNTSGPFSVDGNANYVTYRVEDLTGNVSVTSTGELYCAYFNRNDAAATGAFYSGFPAPPQINFNTTIDALGNCIPNLTLVSANLEQFNTLEWFFDDGVSGFVSVGFVDTANPNFIPTQAGNYQLIGTLSCSGTTFESRTIPVSLCPDDLDNDLIIDNIDVDQDNDGILNCDESRGNVNLNFTDLNQPILNFIDGSSDNTYITTTNGIANLTGDANSNFVSTLGLGPTLNESYQLTFNAITNIEFTQTAGTNHTAIDGETFTLTIGPNTKNITLLDPDNILLVDTNFDGEFEDDVTSFSSSVVRFRYNPSPNGTTPFRLVANSVSAVTFTHEVDNLTETSSFQGNLILTCFGLDTDSDGIFDAFDADSDNDGIPDLIEAQGTAFTLDGNDADLDGLDDAFNGVPVIPVDTDNDGIPDLYDLDSDNDGVYDLYEAQHGQTDGDLDGRIDNATANVGINGLVDALETIPDNFVLSYMINDDDRDLLFSYIDLDRENDGCPDVIEAGFVDPDADSMIGTSPVTVDTVGKVTGIADGYTNPNSNYETTAPIELNKPFQDVAFCEASTSPITIDSTADAFQWEISTDGGNNWTILANDTTYSGVTTATLLIADITLGFDGHQFRVQLQRTGNSCGDVSNAVSLTVEPLPTPEPLVELQQCDDDTDGFSAFNLFEASEIISPANFANETFEFFETEADAMAGVNNIDDTTAYTNQNPTTDSVWARTISAFECYRISEITLTVATNSSQVTSFPPRSYSTCDDFLDIYGNDTVNNDDTDGISGFNFGDFAEDIIAVFPPGEQPFLTVEYYRNEADALAELNQIEDPSNYRNIGYPNSQQIYVRVDNSQNNDCIGYFPLINLSVLSVPLANEVEDLRLCDNGDDGVFDNGIVQTFNLDAQTPIILGTQDLSLFSVSYHLSPAEALSGANAIPNTAAYTNAIPNQQTIYVRVENTVGCFTNHTSFDLFVEALPVANAVTDLEICDTVGLPIDGSAQNGISTFINLHDKTLDILGSQDPNQFIVSYHTSFENAQAGINPVGGTLNSPELFTNSIPPIGSPNIHQIIYVRVSNGDTGCANGISNFNVIVHPEPDAFEVSNLSYCDDGIAGEDPNQSGVVDIIDLDSLIPGILGPDQDQDDYTVTFHESLTQAQNGTDALVTPYTNTTAFVQDIYVRIVNNDTRCINDDFTFQVIVNPLPLFEVTTPQIVCLNEPELVLRVENPQTVYDYTWITPSGDTSNGSQLSIASGAGIYRVIATTTDGTGCSYEQQIEVIESIIANLTEDSVSIEDETDSNTITIDPTNLGIGDYEYALLDEEGLFVRNYQDTPVFDNLEGGIYTILVRDKNGCGVASLEAPVIQYPKFFTPNNDGINDTWAIKGANSFFFPESEVNIFNRYGKLVAQIDIDNPGWNGTFNGKTLPSDDYWFSIKLIDREGNTKSKNGNVSLLRK